MSATPSPVFCSFLLSGIEPATLFITYRLAPGSRKVRESALEARQHHRNVDVRRHTSNLTHLIHDEVEAATPVFAPTDLSDNSAQHSLHPA